MILKNKNVIITGASRGIGKGIAIEFAKNGANIAFTYSRSSEAALKLEKELNDLVLLQSHLKVMHQILTNLIN